MAEANQAEFIISDIKLEPLSDSEFEVGCRLCNKLFASSLALQNHARMSHTEAYETGDPKNWTSDADESSKQKTPKIQKLDSVSVNNKSNEMTSSDFSSLASENVSYIIIKTEDAPEEKKRKRTKRDRDEVKMKRPELTIDPEPITGPFECVESSSIGADGTCHQMFFSCCEYSDHQLTEHARPRRRAARCQVCERPLSQLHQTGPKDFTCEQCSEGFDTVGELLEHKNLFHFQQKRYECSVCHKKFSAQGGVVQHMRMHTGDRPYSCTFCPKAFTQKSGLEQHTRTHTKVKPFRCVICGKTFIQTIHLRQHMRTHTNVAPFQCVVCAKRFKQSSHLNYHLKNHPANMTPEQKEKYREIVSKINGDSARTISMERETALAEQSIQEDGTYDVAETYAFTDGEGAQKVITCEVTQYESEEVTHYDSEEVPQYESEEHAFVDSEDSEKVVTCEVTDYES